MGLEKHEEVNHLSTLRNIIDSRKKSRQSPHCILTALESLYTCTPLSFSLIQSGLMVSQDYDKDVFYRR